MNTKTILNDLCFSDAFPVVVRNHFVLNPSQGNIPFEKRLFSYKTTASTYFRIRRNAAPSTAYITKLCHKFIKVTGKMNALVLQNVARLGQHNQKISLMHPTFEITFQAIQICVKSCNDLPLNVLSQHKAQLLFQISKNLYSEHECHFAGFLLFQVNHSTIIKKII